MKLGSKKRWAWIHRAPGVMRKAATGAQVMVLALCACSSPATEVVASGRIGAEGGVVSGAGITLTFPPGAVVNTTDIEVRTREPGDLRSQFDLRSPVYVLSPAGARFEQPVAVEIGSTSASETARIFWSAEDPAHGYVPLHESDVDRNRGYITHFSEGFIADLAGDIGTAIGRWCRDHGYGQNSERCCLDHCAAGNTCGAGGFCTLSCGGLGEICCESEDLGGPRPCGAGLFCCRGDACGISNLCVSEGADAGPRSDEDAGTELADAGGSGTGGEADGGGVICFDEELIGCPGTGCVDLRTDEEHCGSCGRACASGEVCCGGACVDPTADAHCGAVCEVCGAGRACCPFGGTVLCEALDTNFNCGGCGVVCPPGTWCTGGGCQPPS